MGRKSAFFDMSIFPDIHFFKKKKKVSCVSIDILVGFKGEVYNFGTVTGTCPLSAIGQPNR